MEIPSDRLWAALKSADHLELRPGCREELVDAMAEDFPYLGVLSQHDRYHDRAVPWHWHQELEFFYVLRGKVDYVTPNERVALSAGSAGLVNANVLHMTHAHEGRQGVSVLVHMLRPQLIAEKGGQIWRNSVEPLTSASSVELLYVTPDDPASEPLRSCMLRSFETAAGRPDHWELRLRTELTEMWLMFLELAGPRLADGFVSPPSPREERLKAMMDYVGRHYAERIRVRDLANAAFSSERECHRDFREGLGVTPARHLRDYRIQESCRMLVHTTRPISVVGEMSGLGSPCHMTLNRR